MATIMDKYLKWSQCFVSALNDLAKNLDKKAQQQSAKKEIAGEPLLSKQEDPPGYVWRGLTDGWKKTAQGSYDFVVWRENIFDYGRVVREARADGNHVGIILSIPKSNMAVVVLFDEFLSRFNENDGMCVGMERLSPTWGLDVDVQVYHDGQSDKLLPGSGFTRIEDGDRTVLDARAFFLAPEFIAQVVKQIRGAKEWVRYSYDAGKSAGTRKQIKKSARVRVKSLAAV